MFELVIRVVFSLAVVLGLLWFVARTSSRRFGGGSRSGVRVVARQPLARSSSLAVVEVGERVLVVGVSENGVRLLTEMDPSELPVAQAASDVVVGLPAGRHVGERPRDRVSLLGAQSRARSRSESRAGARRSHVRPRSRTRKPEARLDGSLLSAQTWRQAWATATARNGVTGG